MKIILGQIFRSGKFRFGFGIFMAIVLTVLIYPILELIQTFANEGRDSAS